MDASVKIYGCRVDDTLNTGYRILDNLSRGEQPVQSTDAPKQSKRLGVVNTLESNVSTLDMDPSELAFDADPMFHLMSRKFDEGGAKGLLMANLGLTDGCTIVILSKYPRILSLQKLTPVQKDWIDMWIFRVFFALKVVQLPLSWTYLCVHQFIGLCLRYANMKEL